MGNYKGYFKSLDNISYEVRLIADTSSTYTEIQLAGTDPFVVSYTASNTPFEPVRTSTATISVVANNYLLDILTPYAQAVAVELYNVTTNTVVWEGFLTPKLYTQSYVNEYETFELEAADCLSSLQYLDYDNTAHTPNIVTIKSIIDKICTSCKNVDAYFWTRSKKVGNTILLPDMVSISERNFLSSDTKEWWKLSEVLEEICRYFGFTCLQYGKNIYFLDYRYLHSNNDFYASYYPKATGYSPGSFRHIGGLVNAVSGDVRSNDATISFKPIYNKCVVNDNMSFVDNFIPNIFDDDFLTNRRGKYYDNYQFLAPSENAKYPKGVTYNQQRYFEDAEDADYLYFHRLYDNDYYESVYRNDNLERVTPSTAITSTSTITTDYVGATIIDLGTVKDVYLDDYGQYIIPNKQDYTRYICISERGKSSWGTATTTSSVFKLKDGYYCNCMLSNKGFLVINYSVIFERYANRPYICPDWGNDIMGMGGGLSQQDEYEDGCVYFKLSIGNKYWSGTQWVNYDTVFPIITRKTDDNIGVWNQERAVLNNISWAEFVNEEGYKIPLSGVDLTQQIGFEIMLPSLQYRGRRYNASVSGWEEWNTQFNNYVWLKDFSIKAVEAGQALEKEESDIVYENEIDADAVNTLSDITCRITTSCDLTQPSYSNVIYNGALLTAVTEPALSNTAQKPEQNIVEKYVSQYSSTTKQIGITLDMDYTPFNKVTGLDVDNLNQAFVSLGSTINYQTDSQYIIFEELK